MLNILWFRRDLRVSDHQPLLNAVADGLVAPIVIVEPEYWAQPFASARQWRFAARAITALRSQLAVIGAPLVVRTGDAIETISSLQEKSKDVAIWSHDTTGSAWEVERDADVAKWTEQTGIPWHRMPDTGGRSDPGTLWSDILADSPKPPPDLMIAHGVMPGRVVSERILYLDDDPCEDLPAGPAGARKVLETFMSLAEDGSAGSAEVEEALSGLSPHLAWGALSVREVWYELERLKPDSEEIACALQDRLLTSWGGPNAPRPGFDPATVSFEQIQDTLADIPMLALACRKLRNRGLIREDVLAVVAQIAANRLSIDMQTTLDAIARFRTAFVEAKDVVERYPSATSFEGMTDANQIEAALGQIDPGCFAGKLEAGLTD